MAEFEGNVLRPPGVGPTKTVADPEEILGAYNPSPLKRGGTVRAGVGILRVGEPMKFDAVSKTWVKAATDAEAEALLWTATDATSEDKLVNLMHSGVANGNVTALKGREAAIAAALGGRVVAPYNHIIF